MGRMSTAARFPIRWLTGWRKQILDAFSFFRNIGDRQIRFSLRSVDWASCQPSRGTAGPRDSLLFSSLHRTLSRPPSVSGTYDCSSCCSNWIDGV